MTKLSDRLEDVTRLFFSLWREWRHNQGWRLGPDLPGALLSPYMVDSWDELHDGGRIWFRQHAALVIASIDQLKVKKAAEPIVQTIPEREANVNPVAAREAALVRLADALEMAKEGNNLQAVKLVRAAREQLRKSPKNNRFAVQAEKAVNVVKKVNAGKLPTFNSIVAIEKALASVRSA